MTPSRRPAATPARRAGGASARRAAPARSATSSGPKKGRFATSVLAPGVRLHVLPTDRFTTTICRVALHRDLGPEAAATALLAQVLESVTAKHPSREAVAHRLADLYGAGLDVGVEKLVDRQLLAASLDWPSASLPGRGATLEEGLSFLREVLTDPKRVGDGLDPDTVATEATNLRRAIRALRDDKASWAARRCVDLACAGEPFALDAIGREEDVAAATPAALAALHARLLATAPVEIFVAGDVTPARARAAVREHLLWTDRSRSVVEPRPASSVRAPRAKPRRVVETQDLAQGKLAMAFRAKIAPTSPDAVAAAVVAGVLGGTTVGRFFRVIRETHGLCYYAHASYVRAKGLMLVQSGVDTKNEPKARRLVMELFREAASGALEEKALRGYREAVWARARAMQDERGLSIAFAQEALALGTDPRPESFAKAVDAVRPADARRAGKALALEATYFLAGKAK
jgi:predicted Zn-dependent peptidase